MERATGDGVIGDQGRARMAATTVRAPVLAILAAALAAASGSTAAEQALFESRQVTPSGEYTPGIEGPAIDAGGNLFVVNFQRQGTIGKLRAPHRSRWPNPRHAALERYCGDASARRSSYSRNSPARKRADEPYLRRTRRQDCLRHAARGALHRSVSRRPTGTRALPASAGRLLDFDPIGLNQIKV